METNLIESQGRCLVCRGELRSGITNCSSCDTPTHLKCREWGGGCPTYGCKEMSHALHEELSNVAPQEQHQAYQSFLGKLWGVLNKPVTQISIADLFGSEDGERAKEPVFPYFAIEDHGKFYRLHGVEYRGLLSTYDLQKDYFAGGQTFTINDLVKASQEENKKGGFVGASLEQFMAIANTLHDNKNHPKYQKQVAQVKKSVAKKLTNWNWIICRDKVIYEPKGLDTLVLTAGLDDEQKVEFPVVGPNEYVEQTTNPKLYQLLTSHSHEKVHTVLRWLTGCNPYLWRFNAKPLERIECGVGLGDDGLIGYGIGLGVGYVRRALGVRRVAAQKFPVEIQDKLLLSEQ